MDVLEANKIFLHALTFALLSAIDLVPVLIMFDLQSSSPRIGNDALGILLSNVLLSTKCPTQSICSWNKLCTDFGIMLGSI